MEIYRFLCVPQILVTMVPRNRGNAVTRTKNGVQTHGDACILRVRSILGCDYYALPEIKRTYHSVPKFNNLWVEQLF